MPLIHAIIKLRTKGTSFVVVITPLRSLMEEEVDFIKSLQKSVTEKTVGNEPTDNDNYIIVNRCLRNGAASLIKT